MDIILLSNPGPTHFDCDNLTAEFSLVELGIGQLRDTHSLFSS